jgi:hypothetical protein
MDAAIKDSAKRRLAALALALAAAAALCCVDAGAANMRGEVPQAPRLPAAVVPQVAGPLQAASLPAAPLGLASAPRLPAAAPSALPHAPVTGAVAAPGSPSADPHAAEAPRPAGASAGLTQVAGALQRERGDGSSAAQAAPSAAARAFFDGGLGKAARATAVVAAAATPGGLGMPAAYALQKYAGERSTRPAPRPAPLSQRIAEQVDSHLGLGAAAFVGLVARNAVAGSPVLVALLAALLAFGASKGMEEMLAQARRRVVGGWQASHDQKYRVDPSNGRLKDVRGHKYGDDRYEEYEDGPVSAGERLWARAAGTLLGAVMLSAWSGPSALLFSGVLTLAFAASDFAASRRQPAPQRVLTAEERAHASRFRD